MPIDPDDPVPPPVRPRPATRPPWVLLVASALGTLVLASLVLLNATTEGAHPANLVHPGTEGPSRAVFLVDFPDDPLPDGVGHDGQQFYAIARQPLDLDAVAPDLDRPRYRLQRIAYPALAWALHPGGGGTGLVAALFAVGVAAVFAGSLATGALSSRLGGSPLLALVFPLAPGAFITLRFSTADTLALAAGLGAIVWSLSGRHRLAVAAAVLAVLAKESTILLLVGLLLSHRDRPRLVLTAVPAAVAGAWWALLHLLVEDTSEGVAEFTLPFVGLLDAVRWWGEGHSVLSVLAVPVTLVLGALALARGGLRHPLAGAVALQLAFLPLLDLDVLGPDANGTRMTMPLLVLAAVTLATAGAGRADVEPARPAAGSGPEPAPVGPAAPVSAPG